MSPIRPASCAVLNGRRVCLMRWTVCKPKLGRWRGHQLSCQAGFEFFDHTGKIPWVDYWDYRARRHNDQAFHSKCMTCSSYVHLFLIDWL
jgi:hypothetical protein